MSSEQARQLQERGIQAAKAGNKDEARKLLQQSLRLNKTSDEAWLWLASVARDKRERLLCLKKVLELNPKNEMGIKAVRAMGIDPAQLAPAAPTITDSLAAEDEVVEGHGVPLPDAALLTELQDQADTLIESYLADAQYESNVDWTRKEKGRAGEREAFLLRVQVGAAIATLAILFFGASGLFVANNPQAQLVLFGASQTPRPPTSTPTNTPTSTPGFTPTPSVTPNFTEQPTFTPTSTIPPQITPGQVEITPQPTVMTLVGAIVPAVNQADTLINQGEFDQAAEILAVARSQQGVQEGAVGGAFLPAPWYYEAVAHTRAGDYNSAQNVLDQASGHLERLEGVNQTNANIYMPLINLGYAELHLQQARDAFAVGNPSLGNVRVGESRERAEAVLAANPNLPGAYVTLAEAYMLTGDYDSALDVLAEAGERSGLLANEKIILTRGQAHLGRGRAAQNAGNSEAARADFEAALFQGFYATYVNPFNPAGHELRIQTALELDDPGLGVIYSQEYLFFRPDDANAFRLLGVSRMAEGNNDLALDAYSFALGAEGTDDVIADVLISRAALYEDQRRFNLALVDLTEALELRDTLETRALRLPIAYQTGAYDLAEADAEALLGSGFVADGEIRLIQARILIDEAGPNETNTYNQALGLLNQVGFDVPAAAIPIADEYRARAHFALGNLEDALNSINSALSSAQTGTRRYVRGIIHEAREEFDSAIADYEWVLTWGQVYAYPFADDAANRLARVRETIAQQQAAATAEAITATAEIEGATATVEAEITATASAEETAAAVTPTPEPDEADDPDENDDA